MTKLKIFKRLYHDYTKRFINKILLAALFSIIVALSTSATAWLLDPAIEKIFINKDQTLIFLIPIAIILAFSAKGISLYFAKLIMINVSEEVKKTLQINMLKSFIKADTEIIESKIPNIKAWLLFNLPVGIGLKQVLVINLSKSASYHIFNAPSAPAPIATKKIPIMES